VTSGWFSSLAVAQNEGAKRFSSDCHKGTKAKMKRIVGFPRIVDAEAFSEKKMKRFNDKNIEKFLSSQ
jgi:hypothetical protein